MLTSRTSGLIGAPRSAANTSLIWLSVALAGALSTGVTLAQSSSVLIQEGDIGPTGEVVTGVTHVLVSDRGDWLAETTVEAASGARRSIWIDAQGLVYDANQGITGLPANGSLASTYHEHMSPEGIFGAVAYLDGLPVYENGCVILGDQVVLSHGDPVLATGIPATAEFGPHFSFAVPNDRGQLLVGAHFKMPSNLLSDPVVLRYDVVGSTLLQPGVVVAEGNGPFGFAYKTIANQTSSGFNNKGDSIFVLRRTENDVFLGSIIRNGETILDDGDPTPIAGRRWKGLRESDVALNERGDYAVLGFCDPPFNGAQTSKILVRNGELIARTGLSYPGTQSFDLRFMEFRDRGLADTGAVLWSGWSFNNNSHRNEVMYLSDRLLIEEGVTQIAGQTVSGLRESTVYHLGFDFAISPNGRFVACALHLGGLSSAILMDLQQGGAYCGPAVPNSSGAPATLAVYGSDEAVRDLLFLSARQVPLRAFGLFLSSQTQGSSMPAGSQGLICLGGSLATFRSQVQSSGDAGILAIQVDTRAIPVSPSQPILAGETWNFQTWFRDANIAPTSNFSSAISVTFQ